ncbi:hypothetical protein H2198_001373 [Neophaeococcomyces mojaviensis]|uniref:Uncharacterized protein n=1 Tax=Neophaeococcomyces mojaviensis TaxID=3383035 RepID=A0ACC3AH68_9EURO|nr:hypothetical protein H2198_001373 [Knufia sp. JES_112]
MFTASCLPPGTPDNQWSYCPSVALALVFAILFLATTITHFVQAIRHRSLFCMVIITGALWETAAYAFRILSAKNPTHKASYDASFLLVLLAPICINAFDYMITSRILKTFLPQEHVLGLKGSILGKLSFIVQIGGGLLSLSKTASTARRGLHIVTAGVIFQELLIIYFFFLTLRLIHKLKQVLPANATYRRTRLQINAVQLSLLLIAYRIVYRIVQFTAAEGSARATYIDGHEWLVYVFDAGPMFLALLVMNIWHPGKIVKMGNMKENYYALPIVTRQNAGLVY